MIRDFDGIKINDTAEGISQLRERYRMDFGRLAKNESIFGATSSVISACG